MSTLKTLIIGNTTIYQWSLRPLGALISRELPEKINSVTAPSPLYNGRYIDSFNYTEKAHLRTAIDFFIASFPSFQYF